MLQVLRDTDRHRIAATVRAILYILLLSLPGMVLAQQHALKGRLSLQDGDEPYPYQIVFSISGDVISGYSLTKWPDGREPKALIKGRIDRKQHLLLFRETDVVTHIGADEIMCLVDARLSYRLAGSRFIIKGGFTGKNNGGPCGSGTIEMEEPNTPHSIFRSDTAMKKRPVPVVPKTEPAPVKNNSTAIATEIVNGFTKITEGVQQYLEWHTNICLLEVWDGGIEDGDVISVLLNGKEVLSGITLTKEKKAIHLQLKEKVNTVTIVAGDEGTNPPNTAQMILSDDDEHYKVMAFNKKGGKASVVITRKQ